MGACCGRCSSASTSSACRGFVEVPTSPSREFTRASRGDLRFLATLMNSSFRSSGKAETRRGGRYLEILHRAGEVATPRTADELRAALGNPADFQTRGCMAYATLAG